MAAGVATALVVATLSGFVAVARQRDAASEARVALSQQLVRASASADALDLRVLLAVEARQLDDSPEARGALFDQLASAPAVVGLLRGGGDATVAAVNPDGSLLATGSVDGGVSLWRAADSTPIASTDLFDEPVTALALSGDGELAAGSAGGEVATWNSAQGVPARARAHTDAVAAVAFGDDDVIVTAGRDGLVRAIAPATGESLWTTSVPRGSSSAVLAVDGSTYAQLDDDGTVTAVDLREQEVLPVTAPTRSPAPSSIALAADGRTLAIGFSSGAVDVVQLDGSAP